MGRPGCELGCRCLSRRPALILTLRSKVHNRLLRRRRRCQRLQTSDPLERLACAQPSFINLASSESASPYHYHHRPPTIRINHISIRFETNSRSITPEPVPPSHFVGYPRHQLFITSV